MTMLRSMEELEGYVLEATDGEIGRCKDFLFDDRLWAVRYMLADTGKWLPGQKVLISPISLGEPDWESRRFPVKLTRDQVETSPGIERDEPVSRQYEAELFAHLGEPRGDPHLRSLDEVSGYRIDAVDDEVGHVEDLIVDDGKVIVSPQWIEGFDWEKKLAHVGLTREQIENSPEFEAGAPVNREYETRLYDYYGRPVYWD